MIKEKLLDKDYYLSKLSMFMKESYGIEGNLDLMLDWMRSINSASIYLTNVLDIWNENYKNDMIEKFGYMYYPRVKDETPSKIRGQFLQNDLSEIDISNIDVKFINDDFSYEVKSKNEMSFYAMKKSKNQSEQESSSGFKSDIKYYLLDIENNTKNFVSPKSLKLYEKKTGPTVEYVLSEDETFSESKVYYNAIEENVNTINYIQVSPEYLNLYDGNLYYFVYNDNDSYTQKNPNTMNLKKASYIRTGTTFDNNSYILKGSYFTKATPQNSNIDGTPLLESDFTPTTDTSFINGKIYWKDSSSTDPQVAPEIATPVNCKLLVIEDTDDNYFKMYTDDENWFRYCIANHNNYQIALPYNEIINFYHYSVTYTISSDSRFKTQGKYYNKLQKVTDDEVEGAVPTNVGPTVCSDTEGHPTSDTSFIPGHSYYTENGDLLNPTNLKLLVKNGDKYEYSDDIKFKTGVEYKILNSCSPDSLDLYVYNTSGELEPCQDDYFDSNKDYYTSEGNSVTPYSLELTEKKNDGYTLCEYSGNDNFYYRNYYTNETFKYQLFNDETRAFGTLEAISKYNPYFVYADPYETLEGYGQPFKMLDVIASIVGCTRENKIYYTEQTEEGKITIDETVILSNEDLLDLIKIKIIQNNYKGTLKELLDLYKEKLHYQIYITLVNKNNDPDNPDYESAACNVYLLEDKEYYDSNNIYIREPISDNIKKLFRYSDLFIQSLGIRYNKMYISDLDDILVLNKDYLYKNEKAIYSKEEEVNEKTATKLG